MSADTQDEAKAIEQTTTEKSDEQVDQQAAEKKVMPWLRLFRVSCQVNPSHPAYRNDRIHRLLMYLNPRH
jgi:hypothetical protein